MKKGIICNEKGFDFGYTDVITLDNTAMGMNFGVLKLRAGETFHFETGLETACLVMTGALTFHCGLNHFKARRHCYFYEPPQAMHVDSKTALSITASTHAECVVIQTNNEKTFKEKFFHGGNILECDERGKGLLNDSSHRLVRTIFDKRNRVDSNLVLGEIITYPGHWSSTPSHTHPQPEVYYYRFSEPQGYAFGEQGEEVVRLKQHDTLLIGDETPHAHATAPGYCLYTLWFIRHLPDKPYVVPTFQAAHAWAKEDYANERVWQTVENV